MTTNPQPPLLLALAGPTSSGKTTIATALSLIFSSSSEPREPPAPTINPLITIHADDFYLPDSKIPTLPDSTQDWDCAEALDVPRFESVLATVRDGGEVPWDLVRQGGLEDGERGGGTGAAGAVNIQGTTQEEVEKELDGIHGVKDSPISNATIAALRLQVQAWPEEAKRRRIVLVEGILLFSPHPPLRVLNPLYDTKILLRSTRTAAKRRREARNGYVTLEGFWQDPPGYFDKVVWPGFERAYRGLFVDGDVEGGVDEGKAKSMGVRFGPLLGGEEDGEEEGGLEGVLEWVIGVLGQGLGRD